MYIAGLDPTRRTDNAEFDLGNIGFNSSPDGSKGYIYIQAAGTIGANHAVTWTRVFQCAELDTGNDHPGAPVGVVTDAFADDEYGWVQLYGPASVETAAVGANGVPGATGTDGRIDDTGTPEILGLWITAAQTTVGGNTAVMLTWPHLTADA